MKRYLLPVLLLALLLASSCKQKAQDPQETPPEFNNQLTAEEKN